MKNFQLTTPVLIIAFNRPDLTARVFEQVRKAQPADLYFAANHPDTPQDKIKNDQVKDILKQVDWDCRVHTLFPEINTGHTWGPINAINWIFSENETAIVLEDDCVPSQSFFRYCQELLERYKNDERVFSIGGAVYLDPMPKLNHSYWFSPLTSTWGWASWKRSWQKVDFTLAKWAELRDTDFLEQRIGNKYIAAKYRKDIERSYRSAGTRDFVGWDFIYNFTMLLAGACDIRPAVNLVSNVGFRADANHTKNKPKFADFPTGELTFPLRHPPKVRPRLNMEVLFYKQYDPNFHPLKQKLKSLPLPIILKKIARKLLLTAKKLHDAAKLQSDYKFSITDKFTFIFEHWTHHKIAVKELGDSEGLSKLAIDDFTFYWPRNQNRKELTALWQEVFNNPLLNPHAYRATLNQGDVVIDAGAAEGFFTHYALQKNAKVFAFEPVSILTKCLAKTFEKEIGSGQIQLVQALLGQENKISSVEANSEMLAASKESESANSECVPMTTLDAWVKKYNINKIDFLKMDIEGGEMNAMKGARETLAKLKPKLAIAVYHDYDNARLVADIIRKANPAYKILFRGIFDYDGVKSRPYMVFAE